MQESDRCGCPSSPAPTSHPEHFSVILSEVEGPLAAATFVLRREPSFVRHFDQRGEISCRETTFVRAGQMSAAH
jgi:hypothetical protein